jgi:drug/metabolite transporter (DMT)-like permease
LVSDYRVDDRSGHDLYGVVGDAARARAISLLAGNMDGTSSSGLFASADADLLWNWGLARVPASRAGVFLHLEPLTGAVLGVVVFDERLGITAILGGARSEDH